MVQLGFQQSSKQRMQLLLLLQRQHCRAKAWCCSAVLRWLSAGP